MPAPIPPCRNSHGGGCWKSDVRLVNENSEAWVFQCQTCRCLQVVSKDGVRDRSNFENARLRKEQEEDRVRRWEKRKRIFV